MDTRAKNRIADALDKHFRNMGKENYDGAMEWFCTTLEKTLAVANTMRTRKDLLRTLDEMPELTPAELLLLNAGIKAIPLLIRKELKRAVKEGADDLGSLPGRDSILPPTEMNKIRDEISRLHRQGCELYICKQRVATGYGISVRTVERIWNGRAKESAISDRQAVAYMDGILSRKD